MFAETRSLGLFCGSRLLSVNLPRGTVASRDRRFIHEGVRHLLPSVTKADIEGFLFVSFCSQNISTHRLNLPSTSFHFLSLMCRLYKSVSSTPHSSCVIPMSLSVQTTSSYFPFAAFLFVCLFLFFFHWRKKMFFLFDFFPLRAVLSEHVVLWGLMFRLVMSGPVSHHYAALILASVCSIWPKFSNGDNNRGRPGERRRWVLPVDRVSCMLLQASQLHLPAFPCVHPHSGSPCLPSVPSQPPGAPLSLVKSPFACLTSSHGYHLLSTWLLELSIG